MKFNNILMSLILIVSAIPMQAQDLSEVLFRSAGKKTEYIGQYHDNGKDRNGTGMRRYKNGNVYVGDVIHGKPSGLGMMVVGKKGDIKNAPGAVVYVGDWLNNKKEGHGACYSADGELIYDGIFADDAPVNPYPTIHVDASKYFSDMELSNGEFYFGQVTGTKPDGFGVYVLTDGTIAITRVKRGVRTGLGLLLAGEDNWMQVKWDGNMSYNVISSTKDYNTRKEQYNIAQAKINAELRNSFLELANEGVQLMSQYQSLKNSGSETSTSDSFDGSSPYGSGAGNGSGYGSGSKKGSSGHTSKANSKKNDCGTAWMSASTTYGDYETQLVPNGPRSATNKSDRDHIRSKMKALRLKWESRGCHIGKSPYEDRSD